MKKIFKHKLILATAFLGLFASCNDDEDITRDTRAEKAVVTLSQTNFSVTEGEPVTITLTADKPLSTPMDFKIELVGGEGATFREFTVDGGSETSSDVGAGIIGYTVSMPAYTTTYSFTITPDFDLDAEGTETFQLAFTSGVNARGLVAAGSELITITVANAVSEDFVMRLAWQTESTDWFGSITTDTYIGEDGNEHENYDFDFDLELYDAGFNLLDSSYTECPEQITLSASAPDGDYIIVPSFYTNAIAAAAVPESGDIVFPASLTMSKPGVFTHVVDLNGRWTYAGGGVEEGNPDGYIPVAMVNKTGTTYTVTDYTTGEVLAQGRMAAFKNMLRSKRAKN